jgi:ABC-type uncharacterized transport system permease subunit
MRSNPIRLLLGVLLVLLGFALLLEFSGASSLTVLSALVLGSWGSSTAIVETLVKAAPICLCAFCAAVPARFGLVNIGGDGQLLLGALGASAVALHAPPLAPAVLLSLMAMAAMAAGAAWGLLPGVLRAVARTSETVSSLLLNYVAGLLLLFLIHGPWRDSSGFGWAQTAAFPTTARLPAWPGTRVHLLVAGAPLLAAAGVWLFRNTSLGRSARLISASETTAKVVGLRPGLYYMAAFGVAGAIAGLAGFGEVSAIQGRLREGVSLGYGFAGFLVAWLCRSHFGWMPVAALAIGGLISAGDALQITAGLPFATVDVLQGLILLAVVVHESSHRRFSTKVVEDRPEIAHG